MIDSQEGREKLGCDGMCYGCCHDLPKGHPDRQEPCPIFETCPYNPYLIKEFLGSILVIPIIIVGLIGFFIVYIWFMQLVG